MLTLFLHLPLLNPAPLRLWTTVDMLAGEEVGRQWEPEEARFVYSAPLR